jgi:nicotinate-nucleotide adenylyltransferase
VHNAHLAMARAALHQLKLDRVLWLPTGTPRYRKAPIASAEHRLAMLKLALAGEPRYAIDAREFAPGAAPYTVDTLQSLRAELGPDVPLYLLLGGDQYGKFETWQRPREVERLARIAVFSRPGFEVKEQNVLTVPMEPMPISASDIRARAARGEDLSGLVPPAVANYIARHRLYA